MMDENALPAPPDGLGEAGSRLWRSILTDFEFDEHELAILRSAAVTADNLDRLADALVGAPLTVENFKGDQVSNPLLVEHRMQSQALQRAIASLRIPSGDQDEDKRPQRRGGARGAYGIRGSVG